MASGNEAPTEQPAAARNDRLADGGPRYTETPSDPRSPDAPAIAEPWNTVTATFFILIVAFWAWRLRGRYRDYPFLCCCMPILLAGGIGGTLYHATRLSRVFFLLDLVPIIVLGLAGAVFMAVRYWGKRIWWHLPGVLIFYTAVNSLIFAAFPRSLGQTNAQWAVNLSYANLAIVVLAPMIMVLYRTRFRNAGWVVCGVISFAIAWTFRLVDRGIATELPMGSHWLWHTFGALSTAFIIEYFYLVEGEKKQRVQQEPPPSPAEV